ncbi:hypothetical protein Rsub_00257 [Raphidocelis subcapitata]|uniref:Fungal lipase-type domain-containing protein n=1 Tax=Raphidocelis subcapitata TaxID=307507 RepID=A0A2V0NJW1_9CHLO|nr:hypothetical protein Rsub_00257 [Raphidocelis subcapitata]|eukprot:GBF87546.1 hypothetical protein Rsub_00257 [Raphidocelis subcapitata]
MRSCRTGFTRAAAAAAALALLLAAAALPAARANVDARDDNADQVADLLDFDSEGFWEIPDMQQALRAAWLNSTDGASGVHAASLDAASGSCGKAAAADAGCPALIGPRGSWWTGNADRRNAFLMSVLARDNYPMLHNLGADGDETTDKRALWQCLLRTKWLALGADAVEFYDSTLNNVVVIKAGSSVFVNMRGTWTKAHRDSNMEWRLGPRRRIWGVAVRYHTGWGKTAEDAYAAVKRIIAGFNLPQDECKLWLSGHSRGGGAALLTAAFADGRDGAAAPCKVAGVWTFGSVKPFDAAFAKIYNVKLGAKTWNWWNQIDVVPTLPPAIAGYGTQIPRLRLGANYTCPTAQTTSTCIKIGTRSLCPKRSNGALNHHDYEYTSGLAFCADSALGLTDGCVDALAPPYNPPSARDMRQARKAQKAAERTARAAAEAAEAEDAAAEKAAAKAKAAEREKGRDKVKAAAAALQELAARDAAAAAQGAGPFGATA